MFIIVDYLESVLNTPLYYDEQINLSRVVLYELLKDEIPSIAHIKYVVALSSSNLNHVVQDTLGYNYEFISYGHGDENYIIVGKK